MKKENSTLKTGHGNKSNSATWYVAYNEEYDKYVAKLHFSSAYGCWISYYEIGKEEYDKAGTFEDDDYKTEEMIRNCRRLHLYNNERNYIEPVKITDDRNYRKYCDMFDLE